jgi:hypothetical protein
MLNEVDAALMDLDSPAPVFKSKDAGPLIEKANFIFADAGVFPDCVSVEITCDDAKRIADLIPSAWWHPVGESLFIHFN